MSFYYCSISFLCPPLPISLNPFTLSQVTKELHTFVVCTSIFISSFTIHSDWAKWSFSRSLSFSPCQRQWLIFCSILNSPWISTKSLFPLLNFWLCDCLSSVFNPLLSHYPPILECPWLCPWLCHHLFWHYILKVILIPSWLEKPLWHS